MERSGVSAAVGTPGLGISVEVLRSGNFGIRDSRLLDCSVKPGTVFLMCSGSWSMASTCDSRVTGDGALLLDGVVDLHLWKRVFDGLLLSMREYRGDCITLEVKVPGRPMMTLISSRWEVDRCDVALLVFVQWFFFSVLLRFLVANNFPLNI